MAVMQTGQIELAEAFLGERPGGSSGVLDRIDGLVAWDRLERFLFGLRRSGPGRPGWPVLVLCKALVLQALYGLSERELEEAVADRLSFRRFCGLGLSDPVPDHMVFNR